MACRLLHAAAGRLLPEQEESGSRLLPMATLLTANWSWAQGRSGHGLIKRLYNEEFSTRRKKKLLIQDRIGLLADINQDKHNAHLSHGKF